MLAGGLDHHRGVHDADRRNVEDRGFALEFGIQQFGPRCNRPLDQVRPDAERIGIVDRRDQRHEFGWRGRELLGVRALEIKHLPRRGALSTDLLAVRQLAFGEDGGDIVELLDLPGVERENIARRHQLLQREIFRIEHVKRIRLGDHTFGHIVGCCRDVFNLDPGIFQTFLRYIVAFVHRCPEITQNFRFGRMDIGKSGNSAGACCKADRSGRTLQHGATADAVIEFPTFAHGHLQNVTPPFQVTGRLQNCGSSMDLPAPCPM